MRAILIALALCLSLFVVQSAQAQSFVEGTHYSVVEHSTLSESPEVVEFFSFSCPGCYAMEPLVESMQAAMPEINLRRVHMPYGGRKAKQSQKVFVLMTLLHAEQYKNAIFERIHLQQDLFDSDEEIIGYFVDIGYERLKVEQLFRSFSADTKLRQMNKEGINRKVQSVPSFVVNGRYQVILAAVSSADDFTRLIDYLNSLPE
ncbi:thiol:disulfide interchange protein DsbA/DsbL [Arenicella xantha]|nr:thiol:disulfide interchange protein DsbA/DsbL [Arenicella xantha]